MSMLNEKIEQLNYVDQFILLLLGAKNSESIPSPTHLQKEMYVLQNLFTELADETDYEPYFLGPYSEIVANEAEHLNDSDLIRTEPGKFELTSDGKKVFDILKNKSNKEKIQKIEEFKELFNDLTKDELLAFIYFSYPSQNELEKESIEYADLLQKRRKIAISLYQKDKISAQKATQIAGEPLEDFLQELKNVI